MTNFYADLASIAFQRRDAFALSGAADPIAWIVSIVIAVPQLTEVRCLTAGLTNRLEERRAQAELAVMTLRELMSLSCR
jgi:hypothetical protein